MAVPRSRPLELTRCGGALGVKGVPGDRARTAAVAPPEAVRPKATVAMSTTVPALAAITTGAPIVAQALGDAVAASDRHHPTTFGLDLSQQRDLLFSRPLPSPLNAADNLNFSRLSLLLDLQKEVPEKRKINDHLGRHRTCQADAYHRTRHSAASGCPDGPARSHDRSVFCA